jgi:exodeoxyribonuclease VIII
MQDTDLPFPDDVPASAPAAPPQEQHWSQFPAIVPDLRAERYHRHPAVSKHGLDDFRKAPALYLYNRENHRPPTPALLFGSLYHTVILEPDLIGELYAVVPKDAPKRPSMIQIKAKKPSLETLEAIAWWDNFTARTQGKTIVDAADIVTCQQMRQAMMKNEACRNALEEARLYTEASMFWIDERTGVKCRARPDIIRTDGLIIDPKTCADASEEAFQRAAFNYGYYRQAAMYLDGLEAITGEKPKAFVFLAQESEPPFLCRAYVASPQMIEYGRIQIREDLERFAKCEATGVWPGLGDMPAELNLPAWAMPKADLDYGSCEKSYTATMTSGPRSAMG